MTCWLAAHGVYERGVMPPCHGRLIRAHLLPRQLLAREITDPAELELLVASPATWVPACGGLTGSAGHHGAFDYARTIRVPRAVLPPALEVVAAELGLTWWLDRTYGPKET